MHTKAGDHLTSRDNYRKELQLSMPLHNLSNINFAVYFSLANIAVLQVAFPTALGKI